MSKKLKKVHVLVISEAPDALGIVETKLALNGIRSIAFNGTTPSSEYDMQMRQIIPEKGIEAAAEAIVLFDEDDKTVALTKEKFGENVFSMQKGNDTFSDYRALIHYCKSLLKGDA